MRLFLELIQISLGDKNEFSSAPNSSDWQLLFAQAKCQALVGVLFSGIERIPKAQRPPQQVLFQWYALVERIKLQNKLLNEKCVFLSQFFEKEKMHYCILKGQGIAQLYPNPFLRQCGDIDVWVRPKHLLHSTLSRSRKYLMFFSSCYGKWEGTAYHHVHLPILKDVEIEMHFTPTWMGSFVLNHRLQQYIQQSSLEQFEHQVEMSDRIGRISVPTDEFNRIFILLHIYRHLFQEGIGLRQLMDYYYVLRQPCTVESKDRTLDLIQEFKLKKFAGAVMYVLQQVFALEDEYLLLPANKKEGQFLLNEIMLAGNFGQGDIRNRHAKDEGTVARYIRSVQRNFRFLFKYPQEIIPNPFFRAWFFLYRKWHGWI